MVTGSESIYSFLNARARIIVPRKHLLKDREKFLSVYVKQLKT